MLEQGDEGGAPGAPAASAAAAAGATPARRARPAVVTRAFAYSTVSHPHGEHLLNVGLTRGVHDGAGVPPASPRPRSTTPTPASARGVARPIPPPPAPRCPCESCVQTFAALVPPSARRAL